MNIKTITIKKIIVIIIFYVTCLIVIYCMDFNKKSEYEQSYLYKIPLDTCRITGIEKMDEWNHGGYFAFYTDCYTNYFPIFLNEDSLGNNLKLFNVGSILIKDSNSLNLRIISENLEHQIQIKKPEDLSNKGILYLFTSIIFAFVIFLIITLPYSFWNP
jgi:hypothetical protein